MNKIRSFFNRNRKMIILVLGGIVFLILIIHMLNYIAKISMENNNNQNNTINNTTTEKIPNTSKITGETVNTKITKDNKNIIDMFISYCNKGDITSAYSLLTDECKNILFNTESDFKKYYYDTIFDETKTVNIQNYLNSSNKYTYEVEFYNNVLADGKIAENRQTYTDYITIDTNSNKLNINSFITSKEINASKEYAGIKVTVKEQQIYKDYERYTVQVENTTDKTILLDTRKNSSSIFVVGDNNVQYKAYANEIVSYMYKIPSKFIRDYAIKFNKNYTTNVTTNKLAFTDIVEDGDKYEENASSVNERIRIVVSW